MSQRQWELLVIPLDYKTDLTQEDIIVDTESLSLRVSPRMYLQVVAILRQPDSLKKEKICWLTSPKIDLPLYCIVAK